MGMTFYSAVNCRRLMVMMMMVMTLFYLALLYTIPNNRQNKTKNIFFSQYVSYEMAQICSTSSLVTFYCIFAGYTVSWDMCV